ncbi:MAG: methionine synthase [Anaerolineae bacterium]|nr:methionine synthase [Anaerolineae bacterium]
MTFEPRFLTTHVGSVPYTEIDGLCERLVATLDIPAWPQFSRRTFRENMYVQYTPSLPRVVLDEEREKVTFDTTGDLTPDLEVFYEHYLAEDFDYFALRPNHAAGFFALLDALRASSGEWAKGQVTGPISLGLTVVDQGLRSGLYNDMLADAIVKNAAMNARWQAQQLRAVRPNVIIFADEPYMASFGSAFISLSREQVIAMLDEVFEAIHTENALAGVHCCANTDWAVLLATSVDILNLDAYGYLDNLALYPVELRAFLDRGGVIAWGIVPNTDAVNDTTPEELAHQLRQGLALISEKASARGVTIQPDELATRSLIAPACGLGPTTVANADRAFDMLAQLGDILRQG